ncbi:MAG: lipid-A-disaccharide synthase [Spirosomataceae bacterium]
MRYFVVAGELSGDVHGANLVKALKEIDKSNHFGGWGGPNMRNAGVHTFVDTATVAQMGWSKIVRNPFFWIKKTKDCHQQILDFQPDALILIDFSGFNLRLSAWAKKKNIPVFYFIAPKLWAWNSKRIEVIKRNVTHLFVIFPFEVEFFQKLGYPSVTYVGNPLVDELSSSSLSDMSLQEKNEEKKEIIVLLPGSRQQEVELCLPIMLEVTKYMAGYQFIVVGVSTIEKGYYQTILEKYKDVEVRFNETYTLLSQASLAVVTSGTATLETAWFNVPQVVVYKTDFLTYVLARIFLRLESISLVNILRRKKVVPELIQHNFTAVKVALILQELANNEEKRAYQQSEYIELRSELGEKGASTEVARHIYHILTS